MNKINSLIGKSKTILENGLEPYDVGKYNFDNEVLEFERKALERIKKCLSCDELEDEPISSLRVEDKNIKEASNKMCGDCFCTIPYLLRQDIKKCDKWQ